MTGWRFTALTRAFARFAFTVLLKNGLPPGLCVRFCRVWLGWEVTARLSLSLMWLLGWRWDWRWFRNRLRTRLSPICLFRWELSNLAGKVMNSFIGQIKFLKNKKKIPYRSWIRLIAWLIGFWLAAYSLYDRLIDWLIDWLRNLRFGFSPFLCGISLQIEFYFDFLVWTLHFIHGSIHLRIFGDFQRRFSRPDHRDGTHRGAEGRRISCRYSPSRLDSLDILHRLRATVDGHFSVG